MGFREPAIPMRNDSSNVTFGPIRQLLYSCSDTDNILGRCHGETSRCLLWKCQTSYNHRKTMTEPVSSQIPFGHIGKCLSPIHIFALLWFALPSYVLLLLGLPTLDLGIPGLPLLPFLPLSPSPLLPPSFSPGVPSPPKPARGSGGAL